MLFILSVQLLKFYIRSSNIKKKKKPTFLLDWLMSNLVMVASQMHETKKKKKMRMVDWDWNLLNVMEEMTSLLAKQGVDFDLSALLKSQKRVI